MRISWRVSVHPPGVHTGCFRVFLAGVLSIKGGSVNNGFTTSGWLVLTRHSDCMLMTSQSEVQLEGWRLEACGLSGELNKGSSGVTSLGITDLTVGWQFSEVGLTNISSSNSFFLWTSAVWGPRSEPLPHPWPQPLPFGPREFSDTINVSVYKTRLH